MSDYLMIGEVLKPQGIRGECKIRPWAAEPERFRHWDPLYLEKDGQYVPLRVRFHRLHEGFVYATLGECASAEDAELLRGQRLYVDRAHASPLAEGAVYIADLIGCEAVDEEGRTLGTLREVLQNGPVDTWVFRGEHAGFMAPALQAVFPEVDTAHRRIRVDARRLDEVAVFED